MNYTKIYNDLVDRAKNRVLESYKESHHIIPRCMGGTDDANNLVNLTPEEHYVAHQLLVKIYPEHHGLVKAAAMMSSNRMSNKMYGWLRRRLSRVMSESQSGSGNSQFGTRWIHSVELMVSKKISKHETLPEGWVEGRKLIFESPEAKRLQKEQKLEAKRLQKEHRKQYLSRLYDVYKVEGFEGVKKLGYPHTQQNLVQTFSKNLAEFVPQNGKKRGQLRAPQIFAF